MNKGTHIHTHMYIYIYVYMVENILYLWPMGIYGPWIFPGPFVVR